MAEKIGRREREREMAEKIGRREREMAEKIGRERERDG